MRGRERKLKKRLWRIGNEQMVGMRRASDMKRTSVIGDSKGKHVVRQRFTSPKERFGLLFVRNFYFIWVTCKC